MAINIKNSQEQVLDDIPKIISTTSLMETHNPAGDISMSSKKRRKKRAKNMAMNNNATQIEDQLADNLEASNKVGHCELATNDSPANLLEKVLTVEPLAERRKMDRGFTENLSEGNANTKIVDEVQSMDKKITLTTPLMDSHNPAGDISMSSKKRRKKRAKNMAMNNNATQIEDQLADNLEASNKVGHCELATNDSPANLLEKVLTVEPLAERCKMDRGFTENFSEGNANTKIVDEVQSMDTKITLTTPLMDLHNPAGDISVSSKKRRRRAKKKAINNNGPQIEDQVDDNLKAPNQIGDCDVPNNGSQKNLLETVSTLQPLAEHPNNGGLTENLSEVNATTEIVDEVQSMDPIIILNTSLVEAPNPAGCNSLRSEKNTGNQVDDNLEASNETGDCEVAHNDSPKNLLETVLTVQPLAELPNIDGGLTANLPEGNANRKKRNRWKRIKKKTEIKDDVQSMDPKIISNTSLMEAHNFAGDNSVGVKKITKDQVDDNLKAPNQIGDCDVPNNESQKNLFETGFTVQSLDKHPKMGRGLPENLSEVNATTEIENEVQSMDPKIVLNTSLVKAPNPAGCNSLRSEKNTGNQVDDNLEASNKTGDCEVAHNDSPKNLLETVLTVQPLAELPKIDGGLTVNLPEGNANRKKRNRRKRIKKKTEIKDDVQSMDPKIISNASLMEAHNFTGDNSVGVKKITKDQVDDNLEASKRVGDCEVADNDSQKNLFETGFTVQSLDEHPKMDGGLPENLSEGNANSKKRKRRKRSKKKTEIEDEVLSMDPKIILNTSLMETQNPAGDNSLSNKKNTRDQADDNMEASNRTGFHEVANNDSQKNLLETGLTVQSLAEHPKVDGTLQENLLERNAKSKTRKRWERRQRNKKKTEIKDEVLSVDPKIILNTSLTEMQNPAGYNSLSSKKNTGDQVDDNLEASNKTGDCEVAHNDSPKKFIETVSTEQPLAEHPKTDEWLTANLSEGNANGRKRKRRKIKNKTEIKDGVQSMGQEETVSSDVADVSSNRASSKLLDERSGSLVRPEELEMKMCPLESEHTPPSVQKAGGNAKFENESNEVNFENIVVDGANRLCSFDVMAAECLPDDLDQFPNTAPTTASRKKLLVLDVNGLLAHIVMPAPKDRRGDVHILGRAIFKRPFCDDFLKFCFQNFDVGIWSSRTKKIIDRVVNYLLGDLKDKLLFCWDMSHSTQSGFKTLENTHKPLVCKELRKIWENDDPKFPWKKGDYDASNTLLLDDSPYKALLNPLHTAIFPPSYHYTDKEDDSIGPGGDLRVYLEGLLASGNVREYVERHAFGQSAINETNVSWEFYSRVLHAMSIKLGNNPPVPADFELKI